jgi:cytochrome P450
MVPTPTTDLAIDDIDLGTGEFWERSEADKDGAFALLRRNRPVSWHSEPPLDNVDIERGPGFWAVVRYADVMQVSRNPALFISGRGSNIPDWPPEVLEFLGSMINMDDPRHTKLRLIVNRGFTPHQIGELMQAVEDRARAIVDEVADRKECDFVLDIASRLPRQPKS